MAEDARQALGKNREDLTCRELERRGYVILARRYRLRMGEIDIVARHGQTVVFVEVKTRRGDAFGGGAAAVGSWKQRRIGMVAAHFLNRHRLTDAPCRFDVVTVDVTPSGNGSVEVIQHAFDLTDPRRYGR